MLYAVLTKREIDGMLTKEAEDFLKGLSALYVTSKISLDEDDEVESRPSRQRDA